MAPLNVLVYSGPGATALSTHQALHTLRSLLSPTYSVSTITPAVLLREPWAPSCALLVFPGGGDLGYCRALDGDGTALIRQYLRRGGRYLGFCAGGYFGSARCEFEVGRGGGMEVVGRRELALFPGTCCGGAFAGFEYQSEAGTRAARLAVVAAAASEGKVHDDEEEAVVYCNGGGVFVDADTLAGDDAKGVEVLARYAEDIAVDGGAGKAAIVYCKVGQGHAVLTGPHPEFDPKLLQAQPDLPDYEAVRAALALGNASRVRLMRRCLEKMGLAVAVRPLEVPELSGLHLSSLGAGEVDELLFGLQSLLVREERTGREVLEAELDIFSFGESAAGAGEGVAAVEDGIQGLTVQDDTSATTDSDTSAQDPKSAPEAAKHRWAVHTHASTWPSSAETPRWDHDVYYTSLRNYHAAEQDPEAVRGWGRTLLYGEVVTSTSTLLEKNPILLAALPTGYTMAAGALLAGRGRGGNAWVSPEGALIFSTVVNHPAALAAARPLVFVQYVAAIAVVEAVQGYAPGYDAVPMRLKWPNDVYAQDPRSDPAKPEFTKVAGILSNCSYDPSASSYQLVVGIGVNVNNARPTTSLSALLPPHLAPFCQERLLAAILTRFGALYADYLRGGFTGELERRYYRHWLHSMQLVTVDGEVATGSGGGRSGGAGGPSSSSWKGRVLGVTRDWGMLRVEEVETGPDGQVRGTRRFSELQSDENSFDFWRGLVRRKV